MNNNIDDKGRLMIPCKVRENINSNSFMLTFGEDKSLWFFDQTEWKKFTDAVISGTGNSIFSKNARDLQRMIIAPAREVEIDKHGRISIPIELRNFAELEKECAILNMKMNDVSYIEIWSNEVYQKYREKNKITEAMERGV